jgi:hypothetical protein
MAKKTSRPSSSSRRSPPLSLKPLDFDKAVEGLLAVPAKKKPATKKATGKRKK